MKALLLGSMSAALILAASVAVAAPAAPDGTARMRAADVPSAATESVSEGSVTVGGQRIDYRAVAGTLVVRPREWKADEPDSPEASMFYAAYFKKGAPAAERPVIFIYGGGPGVSTLWLHMGSFGPKRVWLNDAAHTPAPYRLIDNTYSLLDVADVVFIDAPGTGFSEIRGRGKEKAFYGVDEDAHAFARFITGFLSKYGRWRSPKYISGESYGTPRSAVLANMLAGEYHVDLNGVIMLSQILNYDLGAGASEFNPGTDQPYIVALPAYAAAAWYHNRLGPKRPEKLEPFLREVEQFATTDYAVALQAGSLLELARREAIAKRMSEYLGLSADYILKSDLRLDARQFRKMLLDSQNQSIGDIDARYIGPHSDPLAKGAGYDTVFAAIGSAYVAGFNDYVRGTLGYGEGLTYAVGIDVILDWQWQRAQPSNAPTRVFGIVNVMPDLATAMKTNPDLKVQVHGGYFDLSTSYFQGWYEMHHLQIPLSLQDNIEYHYYPSGHMIFLHEPSLRDLHTNIADFIRRTSSVRH